MDGRIQLDGYIDEGQTGEWMIMDGQIDTVAKWIDSYMHGIQILQKDRWMDTQILQTDVQIDGQTD